MASIQDWLNSIGLGQYAQAFADNDIDGDLLADLNDQALKDIGVTSVGHRVKLLKAIAERAGKTVPAATRFDAPTQYTPAHLAERILTSKASLEGERKQVTVLFADLKGSMELLAERDPEEARKILDPVLERMMEAVHRYDGTVNQVMGDGIMALFGAPLALEDHAVRACYAALHMQEAVSRHADALQRAGAMPVYIRVGLNSGEVVVRSIGSDLRMDYSAVGQTTHLAARMEQLAKPGSTLLSDNTMQLAEGYVEVKSLGLVPVKGATEPIRIFELTGATHIRTRLQAAASRGLTRFVGRLREIEILNEALGNAAKGKGQVVAIVGEPGVGKSRLLWEFTHSHRTQGWLIVEASSVSYGKATPYLPVIDLLKGYFKISGDDDARAIREKVTGKLLTLDRTLESLLAPLLALLDQPVIAEHWQRLDPPQRRRQTLDALKRLWLREAQAQPLILVFEDLHWIDSETQEFLNGMLESVPAARLLLLFNYRPEYHHPWGSRTYFTQLRLDALTRESAEELLQSLMGPDPSTEPLKKILIERTEGNPFFLEESVRTLVEMHALAGDRGAYRLTRALNDIQVPATVQAVLAARIDRLQPQDKQLLQIAAVIGKDVPFALLEEIDNLPGALLREQLSRLQEGEYLYEASLFPDLEYTFKHALTHDVAYGSLLQERKRQLHAQIVEGIEKLYAHRLEENAERLAHHALHAEQWDRAHDYLRQAVQKASSRWAFRETAKYLEMSLDLLPHLSDKKNHAELEIDLRLALRTALLPTAKFARIADVLQPAVMLSRQTGDRQRLARALAHQTMVLIELGRGQAALESGRQSLALAEKIGEIVLIQIARHHLSGVYHTLGCYQQAIEIARPALLVDEALLVNAIRNRDYGAVPYFITQSLAESGLFAEARSAGKFLMHTVQASENPLAMGIISVAVGYAYMRQGILTEAISVLERAMKLCETYGLDIQMPWTTSTLGLAYALDGRCELGIEYLLEGVKRGNSLGLLRYQPLRESQLANAYVLAGRYKEATVAAQDALALSRKYQERGAEAWALYVIAASMAQLKTATPEENNEAYLSALGLAEELKMRPLVAHCHLGMGSLRAQNGDASPARSELNTALTMYRDMAMQLWPEQAEAALAALH